MREPQHDVPAFTHRDDFILTKRRIERRDDTKERTLAGESLGLADGGCCGSKASRRCRAWIIRYGRRPKLGLC
jgi:hypothetical protein